MPSDQVVENRVYSEGHHDSGADSGEIAAENEDDLSTDENQTEKLDEISMMTKSPLLKGTPKTLDMATKEL